MFSKSAVHHEGAGGSIAKPEPGASFRRAASSVRRESASLTETGCMGASSPQACAFCEATYPGYPWCTQQTYRSRLLGRRGYRHEPFAGCSEGKSTQVPQVLSLCVVTGGRCLEHTPAASEACQFLQGRIAAISVRSWEQIDALLH